MTHMPIIYPSNCNSASTSGKKKNLFLRPNWGRHWWSNCLCTPRALNPISERASGLWEPSLLFNTLAASKPGPALAREARGICPLSRVCTARWGCRPLGRELASVSALALLHHSQLLPELSRLYYRDEPGRLREQLEVGSRSQANWLQYMPQLC